MPTYRPGVLSTYLGKITRQVSIDVFRKKNCVKRYASQYAVSLDELSECFSGGDTPEQALDTKLLDWVWEHPVDFDTFTMDQGMRISSVSLTAYPEAFADQIPDFEALGYFPGECYLQLKDGVPYTFEGHYYTGVDEDSLEDGSYLEQEGWTEIHWCVDAEPDYYDLQECLGDISQLKKEQVETALAEGSHFSFMMEDCYIKVYCKDAKEAWLAVEFIRNL